MVAGVLFFAPLVYFGELGAWAFSEPVSNLVWDEGGIAPQQSGGGGGSSAGGGGSSGPVGGDGGGSGSGGSTTQGRSGGGGAGAAQGGSGSGANAGVKAQWGSGGSAVTGRAASSGSGAGALGSGPTGWFVGGSGTPDASICFAGLITAFFVLGLMFLMFAQAMAALLVALAHALALWAWALVIGFLMYLLAALGVLGGLVVAGGAAVLLFLHAHGHLLAAQA